MGGDKVNINYYRNENWVDNTFSRKGKRVLTLLVMVLAVGLIAGGCGVLQNFAPKAEEAPVQDVVPAQAADNSQRQEQVEVPDDSVEIEVESDKASTMVSYDVTSIGRSDPFMPSGEIRAFEQARASAVAEANAHNAKIRQIEELKNVVIRQPDDISPYSFNLPVPPTALAPSDAAAAKITRTKVVGIMFNSTNPSAIINVDDKDYLVRQGDKIMDQEYKVIQINKSWITVGLGSNIYSASIGELFSKDEFDKAQNDLYNLKNRFGGRKG